MKKQHESILKIILINILIFFIGIIVVLGGYEIYLRIKIQDPNQIKTVIDKPIYSSDSDLGWYHKSNIDFDYIGEKSSLNQFGQRSNFNPQAKKRILFLGDSFTFGMNVTDNQTMSAFIQKKLDPKTWTMMNAGVIGYTIGQELIYLTREFEKLKPDLVILNIFVGNDLTEQRRNHLTRDNNGNPLKINDSEVFVNSAGYLASHTPLPFNSLALADIVDRWKQMLIKQKAYPGLTWGAFINPNDPLFPKDMPQLWEQYQQDLQRMQKFLADKKIPFLVVIIPMDTQVDKSYWIKYPNRVFGEKEFQEKIPQQHFSEICKDNKLNCLDLLPIFQKNTHEQLYFKDTDPHFDVPGNKLAAESILDKLSTLQFLQ